MANKMFDQLAKTIRESINVSNQDMEIILSHFEILTPKKNEILVSDGQQHNQRMYFVCEGCLRLFFINENGIDSTRHFTFENHFATALVSFITGEPSIEYIQALEQTKLLYISKYNFMHLLDTIPVWEKFYRHYLENAYVTNTRRLKSFATMDAKDRYKQLLDKNPVVVKRLPNKIVASYINISQETLSRLKSKL